MPTTTHMKCDDPTCAINDSAADSAHWCHLHCALIDIGLDVDDVHRAADAMGLSVVTLVRNAVENAIKVVLR